MIGANVQPKTEPSSVPAAERSGDSAIQSRVVNRIGRPLAVAGRQVLFTVLVASITVVSSERMFWYWDTEPWVHPELSLYYALAVAGPLWLISRYGVHNAWGMALAVPVFGYLVEGLVTPVVYSGGPFVPFFPLWFAAWHGGLSLWLLVFQFRSWLLGRNFRALTVASVGFGVLWGLWSITLLLPENTGDEELLEMHDTLEVLEPAEFGVYALWVGAVLIGSHWLLGRRLLGQPIWLSSFRPGRLLRWPWWAWAAMMAIAWTVGAYLWALPMLVVYTGLQVWALRRAEPSRPGAEPGRPGAEAGRPGAEAGRPGAQPGQPVVEPAPVSWMERLEGPVSLKALAPLVLMPVVATAVYTGMWVLDGGDLLGRFIMYGIIVVQTLIAVAVAYRSLRWAFGHPKPVSGPDTTASSPKSVPTR
jgi:hypothetical protein